MKLLICPQCDDVVSLSSKERWCGCGQVSGYEIGPRTEVWGGPLVIGLETKDLQSFLLTEDSDTLKRHKVPSTNRLCLFCGKPMSPNQRKDTRTCSGACRVALYRARQRVTKGGEARASSQSIT